MVSASLNRDQKKYIEDHDISPTRLMKSKMNEIMNNEENPYKYTPTKYLSESRKTGIILMLGGALVLLLSTIVATYLLLSVEINALEMTMIFSVMWLSGCAITYYGFREYGKYNDIIYYRGLMTRRREEEETETENTLG